MTQYKTSMKKLVPLSQLEYFKKKYCDSCTLVETREKKGDNIVVYMEGLDDLRYYDIPKVRVTLYSLGFYDIEFYPDQTEKRC